MRRGRVRTGTELAWWMLALSKWRMRRTVAIADVGVIALSLGASGVVSPP